MKKALLIPSLFVLIALGMNPGILMASTPPKIMIAVALDGKDSGGCDTIPAKAGYISGEGGSTHSSGGVLVYDCRMKFEVVSPEKDQLAVKAHYVIRWSGSPTPVTVDKVIPVLYGTVVKGLPSIPPEGVKRVNIDRDLVAYAFLTETN